MESQPNKNGVELLERQISEPSPSATTKEQIRQEHPERSPEEARIERKLLFKIDFLILPLLWTTYLLAFLDRSDIGNAAVAGMVEDLHMTAEQFSTAAAMFYVTYIIFQLPGNIFLRIITPPVQLALALMTWGLFNTLLAVAKNYETVLGLRLGVGFGEAFFQAAPIYLSLWYKRNEFAFRGAIFFSASAASGAFNGLIAYGLEKDLDGARGLAAWRWLFIVEGTMSIAVGFVVLALLPATPERARRFFTQEERKMAIQRNEESFNDPHAKIHPPHILAIMKDWSSYFYIVLYACANASIASFSTFLPIILEASGYSALRSQVLTIPVYIVGVVGVLATTYFSDRLKHRGFFLFGSFIFCAVGWLILLITEGQKPAYAAAFLISFGVYSSIVLATSWMNTIAAMYAIGSMIAQCFSIAATKLYSTPPHYYSGNGFALGCAVVGAFATLGLMFRLNRKNREKRDNSESDEAHRTRPLGVEEMGNRHPDFYFYI